MAYAVRFEGVDKRYFRGGPEYRSVRSELVGLLGRAVGRRRGAPAAGKLALRDVSFQIADGESVALVGPNGAGKTTTLKLVSRIAYPSAGTIRVRGRVGALIEVGSGLHSELTGRDNIWLYGQILGLSKVDIRRRFDAIVDFSELPSALDTPVKMYSSGMKLRLGFAVASHLDPDIFVVDEALAVGDAGFQVKCVEHISRLIRQGRTLLFVSHDLTAVESLCGRGLLLLDGTIVEDGDAREVVARYLAWTEERRAERAGPVDAEGPLRVISATCHDLTDGAERHSFSVGEGCELRLRLASDAPLDQPHVAVGITDGRPGLLVECSMVLDGGAPDHVGTDWECRLRLDGLPLKPRVYQVWCSVVGATGHGSYRSWAPVTTMRVTGRDIGPAAAPDTTGGGAVAVDYEWRIVDPAPAVSPDALPRARAEGLDQRLIPHPPAEDGPGVASTVKPGEGSSDRGAAADRG